MSLSLENTVERTVDGFLSDAFGERGVSYPPMSVNFVTAAAAARLSAITITGSFVNANTPDADYSKANQNLALAI
jgi:hypothetical protein